VSPEWIGWCATALFALSYFVKEPRTMRRVQAGAASVWIAYGAVIKAPPVVVANVVVAALALVSSGRRRAD
jgi:Bacterial inner membrane protein